MCPSVAKRPRRKAKQERSRATVEVILDGAARILTEQGYASATTNRIAEVAGVSIGTLYEYFRNREEVFDALIARELGAVVDIFGARGLGDDLAVIDKLMQLVRMAMTALRFGPELFRALEQAPDAIARRRLAEARKLVTQYIERLLDEHRSELRVPDVALAAFVTVSAVEGIAINASNDRFDERLASEIESLLRAYLTGDV
jgi:AcrR family transcriptional regulator